jgi:hypothetical protein
VSATRPLALVAAVLVLVQIPLALSAPTAALLVLAYGLQCAVVSAGAAIDAFRGRATRARRWGFAHLVASVLVVAGLEVGARVQGGTWSYWGLPFAWVLAVGWLPPLVAFGLGALATDRGRRRIRRLVRARRAR